MTRYAHYTSSVRTLTDREKEEETFKREGETWTYTYAVFSPEVIINGLFRASIEWHEEVLEGIKFGRKVFEGYEAFGKETLERWRKLEDMLSSFSSEEQRTFVEGFLKWREQVSQEGEFDVDGYMEWLQENPESMSLDFQKIIEMSL